VVIWTPLAQADLKAIHAWRVIYHVQADKKFVLTLFHKRRDLKPDDIKLNQ
jgi:plasmid stabilization system protein ParE